MTIVDKVTAMNGAVQAFAQTGLATVEKYHQAAIEAPVDLARSLGLGKTKADAIKNAHQRMVKNLYGAVGSVNEQLGDLFVLQLQETESLVADLMGADKTESHGTAADKPVSRKKVAAKKAKKKAKKKAAKKKAPAARKTTGGRRSASSG